ncbi:Transglutaminase-like superfamily protein [Asanoa hainanensis]|uniref:Transglutaminase-like superfamily protein n=1 Tax=Asanoa hainanensis TaxID=560556 RepID=A0A239P8D1_9ACTN|nr:transglutaminase domain-containing protein [Asanoa hainanensis]SNT62868.1 Transglutaminase-like superfamily protein [Asanoa hainanensis]
MTQTYATDPGRHAALLDHLPADVEALGIVVRNVVGGAGTPGADHARLVDLLDADQARYPGQGLRVPRGRPVGGTCRSAALLMVAALRHRSLPARSRVGFAPYLGDAAHVVVSYHDGRRWLTTDPRVPGATGFVFPGDAWLAYRAGTLDAARFGGGAALRDAVLRDLAHVNGTEVRLTDEWGPMGPDLVDGLDVIDDLAALLVSVSRGDAVAARELVERYASDHRIRAPRLVLATT